MVDNIIIGIVAITLGIVLIEGVIIYQILKENRRIAIDNSEPKIGMSCKKS